MFKELLALHSKLLLGKSPKASALSLSLLGAEAKPEISVILNGMIKSLTTCTELQAEHHEGDIPLMRQ